MCYTTTCAGIIEKNFKLDGFKSFSSYKNSDKWSGHMVSSMEI